MEFGVWGLGFRFWVLRFRIQSLRVGNPWRWMSSMEPAVGALCRLYFWLTRSMWNVMFRVWGLGFRGLGVRGLRFRGLGGCRGAGGVQ